MNPSRNRKGENGNPLPKANASEFDPHHSHVVSISACLRQLRSRLAVRPTYLFFEFSVLKIKAATLSCSSFSEASCA